MEAIKKKTKKSRIFTIVTIMAALTLALGFVAELSKTSAKSTSNRTGEGCRK